MDEIHENECLRVTLGLALGYESQLVKYPDLGYWIIGRDTKF